MRNLASKSHNISIVPKDEKGDNYYLEKDVKEAIKELKKLIKKFKDPIKDDISSGEYQILNIFEMKINEIFGEILA